MQQNLDNIIELASKGKILTTEQVDKFLSMVLKALSTQRKELDTDSKQRMSEMKEVMKYIEVQHKEILSDWTSKLDSKSQKTLSDFTSNVQQVKDTLKEAKDLLKEVKAIEMKDGKDADEEVIVEKVIDRIKIEPDVVTLSGSEIKKKLEALKGEKKLDAKAIKGFDLYAKKVDLDYAVKTLQHQTSFLINKNTTSSGGSGTVTGVSVASANGLAGTSNGDPTSPQLTLSTSITGVLKGNGTAISAAVSNTDYQAPITLTTTGTSGTATFNGTTLNIPNYSSGSGGITRSVNVISSPTTAGATAATDYVYLVSGTTTLTLPTAVGNTNLYTVKRTGTNTVTIATTSAQTIDGSSSATILVRYVSLDFISDGSNWNIV